MIRFQFGEVIEEQGRDADDEAAEAIDEEDAARLERKLRGASFDFNDFLAQFKMMRKMGPLENVLGMLPGMGNVQNLSIDEKQLKRTDYPAR